MKMIGPALALVWALVAVPSHAMECPGEQEAAALSAVDSEVRLAYLAGVMDQEVRALHIWSWSWGSLYGGAAVSQIAVRSFVHDPGVRVDLAVGAASAAFGSASLFGLPLRITSPLRRVRGRWAEPDRCALLRDAEQQLRDAARVEALTRSWVSHAGNVAFNAGLALILGLGYHRWTSAGISMAVGTVVGETNLLTEPHGLPTALESYRRGELTRSASSVAWGLAPLALDRGAGLQLSASF